MEKHLTAGVAGHVDHGKTTLVRCLTGIDTDRMREEKERRLSIDAGIAPLRDTNGLHLALVDVPGHTDFLKNTIRGLSAVDFGILVVAADDGVMPQTIEHIDILSLMGAGSGLVVLSKTDLVDRETAELAALEIADAVTGTFLENRPIIPFSAMTRKGLDDIMDAIDATARNLSPKTSNSPVRLWIDQVRSLSGFGTVVSGTLSSGILRVDSPLFLPAPHILTRVRSLQVHHRPVDIAYAGQRVGIALAKVPNKSARRGMALVDPGHFGATYLIDTHVLIRSHAVQPLRDRQRVKLYAGTAAVNALVLLMAKEQLGPGESGLAQFRLLRPLPVAPGDRFIICPLNLTTVLGGGEILEIPNEKFRVCKAERFLPRLQALRNKDADAFLDALFAENHLRLLNPSDFLCKTSLTKQALRDTFSRRAAAGLLTAVGSAGFVHKERFETFKRNLVQTAETLLRQDPLKRVLSTEELRNACTIPIDDAPFQRALDELCIGGAFVKVNGCYAIPHLKVELPQKREKLAGLLLDFADQCRLVPFSADTFWKAHGRSLNKNEIQRLLDYLHAAGRLIRLGNRRFLSPEALREIKRKISRRIREKGFLDLSDSKEILGYGRTVGIPVLEYLDDVGFTTRKGNTRILNGDLACQENRQAAPGIGG